MLDSLTKLSIFINDSIPKRYCAVENIDLIPAIGNAQS